MPVSFTVLSTCTHSPSWPGMADEGICCSIATAGAQGLDEVATGMARFTSLVLWMCRGVSCALDWWGYGRHDAMLLHIGVWDFRNCEFRFSGNRIPPVHTVPVSLRRSADLFEGKGVAESH